MLDTPKNAEASHADGKILQSVRDGVGVITFNNPDKRNAMSLEMWEGLGHALVELRDDPDVRVVILVGAGDKAFVSGADISQFEKTRHNAAASEEYSKRSEAQRALMASYPKPTIACIRGFCLGGGMQVAMLTDIRIASDNSQFGIPAAKLGIAYGYDGLKSGLAGRAILGTAHHVHGHADRGRGSVADWTGRSHAAGRRNYGTPRWRSRAPSPATRRWRSRPPRSPLPKC